MSAPGSPTMEPDWLRFWALARAVHSAHLKPQRTILFVADVGEEGEGNLRGMRAVVEAYRSTQAVVFLDGSGTTT